MTYPCDNRSDEIRPVTKIVSAFHDPAARPLVVIRWVMPFLLLATLATAILGCAKTETFPPGSYCLLTDEYLHKIFSSERVPVQEEKQTGDEENI